MSIDTEGSNNKQVKIGNKVSLLFEESDENSTGNILMATFLFNVDDSEDSKFKFLKFSSLNDKVWIQIGENLRLYAKKFNDSSEEKLIFELDKLMVDDLIQEKKLYAGIDHLEYNIKTKEIANSTVKTLASQFR
tara:strand:- start:263 stop:664 length:402 start_codon:yes stop_codon:yes gene_type:complete